MFACAHGHLAIVMYLIEYNVISERQYYIQTHVLTYLFNLYIFIRHMLLILLWIIMIDWRKWIFIGLSIWSC